MTTGVGLWHPLLSPRSVGLSWEVDMTGSRLAWLDHSEAQRRRMLEVVRLFSERDTIDDLGLGSVRDLFSDLLFPGTSVLLTRARYLLFVPWLFQQLEVDRVRSADAQRVARDLEVLLIGALVEGGESTGVIGGQARGNLKQLPSAAYWGALGRFGIRTTSQTRSQVLASLDRRHAQRRGRVTDDDGDAVVATLGPWHPALPAPPADLLDAATFTLTVEEADYLRDRIRASSPDSALAFLLSQSSTDVDDVWDHPALAGAPAVLRDHVLHAEMFSEVIHGAPLLYNRLLADASRDLRPDAETLVDQYDEQLEAWSERLDGLGGRLQSWADDQNHFWQVVNDAESHVPEETAVFARWWFSIAPSGDRLTAVQRPAVAAMIRNRERSMKRARARLSNRRQLERWQGAIGTGRLRYRWPTVKVIVDDVLTGLRG